MEDRRPLLIRLAVALGALALLCAALGAFAWASRPPALRSHADLVAYGLRERGIPFGRITLGEAWPDRTNRQYGSYAGPVSRTVNVLLPDGGSASGWLVCHDAERDCELSLAELGIDDAPLPDMGAPEPPEWLRWLADRAPWLFEA